MKYNRIGNALSEGGAKGLHNRCACMKKVTKVKEAK